MSSPKQLLFISSSKNCTLGEQRFSLTEEITTFVNNYFAEKNAKSDSCINNVKLSLNCTKDYATSTNHSRKSNPYVSTNSNSGSSAKSRRDKDKQKLTRVSLDNVSINPWGAGDKKFFEAHSSLRRCRSLAISGENLYGELTSSEGQRNIRSQLIPRAKLIKENNRYKGLSADNLSRSSNPPQSRRNSSQTLQDFNQQEPLYSSKRQQPLYSYTSLQNIHENSNQQDSLDSNHNNKSSIGNIYRVSYEDLPELSLPNYYPDARYDTDNTDNISLTDNISSLSLDNLSKYKDIKWEKGEYESISYDENIVLSQNKTLYEDRKPRTIRNPTPYNENYGKVNPNSSKSSDTTSEDKPLEQTDTNFDEINLEIENITKLNVTNDNNNNNHKEPIKTLLEVPGSDADPDQYKTIVTVDTVNENLPKTHSHNYLREFLETQKGSKKPLQNFLAKKFSNLSRKSSKNLTDSSQFHSLPDISISKNLRKCEKIDRKLRKCNKNLNESRFIINIGKHFDLTSEEEVPAPVDFEVKIAKVPKNHKKQNTKPTTEEQFIEAVKQLKDSLNENRIENNNNNMEECGKNTMQNYWDKVMSKEDTEKCKVVDVTAKVDDVRKIFENPTTPEPTPNKVQLTKQIFEPKPSGKISPNIKESCSYFENKKINYNYNNNDKFQSLCPNSVEIIDSNTANDMVDNKENSHKSLKHTNSIGSQPEFDHVRYKLVKSDLFQKKIFANCDKECQFDDLIQYLQDYSFQELLVDNNIVIIEPIRSKVPYEPSTCVKSMKNINGTCKTNQTNNNDNKSSLNRKFFYHPIRVNKEVNENELPSPDTVRQVRQLFESGVTKSDNTSQSNKEMETSNVDPDKDRCSATDSNSNPSNISDFGSQENLYDSIDNEIYCEYISEDILKKIREKGTTVTYYGGRIVNRNSGQSVLTNSIMDEIKFNEKRCMECSNCKKKSEKDYMGVKFKIVKSNSCSSRLELVGTDLKKNNKQNNEKKNNIINEENTSKVYNEKNAINENIKKHMENNTPKIIGEEMKIRDNKVTQWKDISEKSNPKIYNFYEYDKIKEKSKKIEEMEFEPYEVA